MALIGNLGKLIVFEVSSDKVLTFNKLIQEVKGRWTSHKTILSKPKSEFLGPELRSGQLAIFLSVNHGVRPRTTLENIEKAVESGAYFPLVIGGKKVGDYQWKITQVSETWGEIIKDGRLASANVTLTLEEYV